MIHAFLLQVADEAIVTNGFEAIQKITGKIGLRLIVDFAAIFALIRLVYFPAYKKRELFFTFFIFNIIIFFICFLLNKVELSMGAAFGLFAVFSMLRYRTEDISIKDMTYLFLVIAIGLISAVTKIKDASEGFEVVFLALINAIIVLVAFILDSKFLIKKEVVKIVNYENIELIHEQRHPELIEDLKKRTGINVHRISVQKIDFLNDSAQIKIYYFEQ